MSAAPQLNTQDAVLPLERKKVSFLKQQDGGRIQIFHISKNSQMNVICTCNMLSRSYSCHK